MHTSLKMIPVLCGLMLSSLNAETTVISDDFTSPVINPMWKTSATGISVLQGTLVLANPVTGTSKGKSVGIHYVDKEHRLDLSKTTVNVTIDDLDITGISSPQNSVFMLYVTGNAHVAEADDCFQLRIDGEGSASLWLYSKTPGSPDQKRAKLALLPCILPVKKINLTLRADSGVLTMEDESGGQRKPFDLKAVLDTARWSRAPEYHLMVQGVTKNDAGSTTVSIGGINVSTEQD